jgi:hypothetical protein
MSVRTHANHVLTLTWEAWPEEMARDLHAERSFSIESTCERRLILDTVL